MKQLKEYIRNTIISQCKKIPNEVYKAIPAIALSRMTYIIVPVWQLDELLNEFVDAL